MKNILCFFLCSFFLFSCETTPNQSSDSQETSTTDTIVRTTLNTAPPSKNASHFMEEMKKRKVTSLNNDSISFLFSFDLHGADCIAPDCYSTDVSFKLATDKVLQFPKTLDFQSLTHGCIPKPEKTNDSFQLIEENDQHIIYHSESGSSTLALFKDIKKTGTYAYYFEGTDKTSITGKNVYIIAKEEAKKEHSEEGRAEGEPNLYPYMSRDLFDEL